ncbi:MAG: AMP-binding protein [Steroidobacteraceae bacterium]
MSKLGLSGYTPELWLRNYRPGHGGNLELPPMSLLDLFEAARSLNEDQPALMYFDDSLSYDQLDEMSGTLAAHLLRNGFATGDRLAICMQNMPQFVIAALAAWKAGGIVVPISPMNQVREINAVIEDCRPHTLLCLDILYDDVISRAESVKRLGVSVIVTGAQFLQAGIDQRVLPDPALSRRTRDCIDLPQILEARTTLTTPAPVQPDDLAFLVYTSGTTGVPKAALISHGNASVNARCIAAWYDFQPQAGPVLAIAPLFHVTGLVGHMALSWAMSSPLILMYRFEASVVIDTIRARHPIFMVGAITAYNALIHHPNASANLFDSFHVLVSGGAPISPSIIDEILAKTGHYVHNGYGLTETSAGVICVPYGTKAPVDHASGALSIGVPAFDVHAWIADDAGAPVAIGQIGEIVISGPAVARGYWNKPEESASSMRPDGFRTGDIGFVDANGWFYVVDRKKDMINCSGYKVWPREVEDVIVSHPAIYEASVIGIPDPYRTESVCAVISLHADVSLDLENLKQWCQDRLAVYKRPREYVILDALPKTPTGKVLKRELRVMLAHRAQAGA